MDNTTTPRLVELVTRAQAIAKALNYIAGLARQMEVRQGCHKAMLESDFIASALSRLMAEGGLSKEPLGPLGPEEELAKMIYEASESRDYIARWPWSAQHNFTFDHYRKVAHAVLLQANEVKRLSNPVDDGAVERACVAAYNSRHPNSRISNYEMFAEIQGLEMTASWNKAFRAALKAAEPHP